MPLYHFQIGFPKGIAFAPIFGLRPSPHAITEFAYEGFHDPGLLPKHFLPRVAKVIEIEVDATGNLIKLLARQSFNVEFDLVYSVYIANKVIKTVWLNHKNDKHFTLDRSKYDIPPTN